MLYRTQSHRTRLELKSDLIRILGYKQEEKEGLELTKNVVFFRKNLYFVEKEN